MSSNVLALYLAQTALLVSILVALLILRDTFKRTASPSVVDPARCLELSTQWNQTLLEQVAQLSKEITAMREALHFYAEPDTWSTSPERAPSRAFTDRGEIARAVLCDTHASGV